MSAEKLCNDKECRNIGVLLPLSSFSIDKNSPDGRNYKCSNCCRRRVAQYYVDNTEERKMKAKETHANNPHRAENDKKLRMSEGYGVYLLIHIPTQKYYVGEGMIWERKSSHLRDLEKGKNTYGKLQEHYDKDPCISDWEYRVIRKWDEVNKDEGKKIETKLIKWGFDNVPKEILNKTL